MTATLLPESKSSSRRALLAGALGGIGAWAASAAARVSPVRAADDDPMLVGGEYTGSTVTRITNSTTSATVLWGESSSGIGVRGSSSSYIGVRGSSSSYIGVFGTNTATDQPASLGYSAGSNTGVQGFSGGPNSLPAAKPKTGVYGYANQDSSATGVRGESTIGVGVRGKATTGYAGYFDGRVFTTRYYELGEIATPNAPAANQARLFVRDSGGKTQLCVRYNTGAVQVLNTQP